MRPQGAPAQGAPPRPNGPQPGPGVPSGPFAQSMRQPAQPPQPQAPATPPKPSGPSAAERARSLIANTPQADQSEPTTETFGPVLPGTPVPPPPRPTKPPEPPQAAGDLICPQCGSGNEPERNFCARCGHSLKDATVYRPPWYRRIFMRKRVPVAAGDRPVRETMNRRRRRSRRLGLLVKLAIPLALIGGLFVYREPIQRFTIDNINRYWPKVEAVRPIKAAAFTSERGHPASAAVLDLDPETFWAEGAPGTGENQRISARFAEPVDLAAIGIYNGASSDRATYLSRPRPRQIRLFPSSGGSVDLTLADEPGKFQEFKIEADGVQSVGIQILNVYPAVEGKSHAASLSGVEFFARQCRICG